MFIEVHSEFVSETFTALNIKTLQKMKFPIKDFFSKCDQIGKKLRIWSHLLKKSLIENFIFCAERHGGKVGVSPSYLGILLSVSYKLRETVRGYNHYSSFYSLVLFIHIHLRLEAVTPGCSIKMLS